MLSSINVVVGLLAALMLSAAAVPSPPVDDERIRYRAAGHGRRTRPRTWRDRRGGAGGRYWSFIRAQAIQSRMAQAQAAVGGTVSMICYNADPCVPE